MKIAGYEVHPAADEFPLLDAARLEELAASIQANGQRDPIVLMDGKILDGRNRARACEQLGIKPTAISFVGDPWEFVWDKNGERRDLEKGQRAAIRLSIDGKKEAARVQAEADLARSEKLKGVPRSDRARPIERALSKSKGRDKTAKAVAKKAKTSVATVKRAKKLQDHAPEMFDKVRKGELTLNQAHSIVSQAEARAKIEAQAKNAPERALVHLSSALEFIADIGDGSVDLLLTDPPYSTDVPDIVAFSEWIDAALPKVKPTGRAYICVGAYPAELNAYLSSIDNLGWMKRCQVLVWTYRNTIGPKPTNGYKLNWQAILYLWGEKAGPLDCPMMNEQFSVQDINAPDGRLGDRYHAWQKPDELGERFVRHATKPGDLVVDPFAGTGSFLLAAAKLGRRAIGCDINPDNLKIAEQRGCVVEKAVRYA